MKIFNKAFTLVELLVSISIVAIIITAVMVSVGSSREKGRDVEKINNVTQIQIALENYKKIEGSYPIDLTFGEALIGDSGIVFLDKVPDVSYSSDTCPNDSYSYHYNTDTRKYSLQFCLENNIDDYQPGEKCVIPEGILNISCDSFRVHTIAYTAGPNGNVVIEGGLVTAVPDVDYRFVKWSDGSTDNPRSDLTASTSLNIVAEFTAGIRLIFHAPCNNSLIDVVSGLTAKPSTYNTSNWTNPEYVLDPTDSSRYVLKKKNGAYFVPIVPGLPALEQTTGIYPRFVFAANSVIPEENDTYKFLDSFNSKFHRLEFDIYIANQNTTRPFYMHGGLYNWNTNAQNNGYEIGIYGGKIRCAYRNNVSSTSFTDYDSISTVANKWVRFTVDISEVDSTHYNVAAKYIILSTGVETQMISQTLIKPGTNNRGLVTFFSDHYGNGSWSVNNIDYIRDIKIYELPQ